MEGRRLGRTGLDLGVLGFVGADVLVATKARVAPADFGRLGEAIPRSLEQSPRRLQREAVDLFQLHNPIGAESDGQRLGVEAAFRFPLANPGAATVLAGTATPQEFAHAAGAMEKGPLPPAAMRRLAELQAGFAGEVR